MTPRTAAETVAWLEGLRERIGSVAQYEVHRCHWPDARCVICEAWEEVGQLRVAVLAVLCELARAGEAAPPHSPTCNSTIDGEECDPALCHDPGRTAALDAFRQLGEASS